MKSRVLTNILIVVNIILAAILIFILWLPSRNKKEAAESRIFFTRDISSLPYWVAKEKGYFDSLHVKVTGDEVPRISDEIDMVGRGTLTLGIGVPWDAFIGKATTNLPKYRVIYSVFGTAESPQTALVARKDAGITSLAGLTGKRLGFNQETRQNITIPAILLGLGVDTTGIRMTPLSASEMATAFVDNRCDALVALEPYRTIFLADTDDIVVVEDGFLEKHLASQSALPVATIFTSVANLKLRNRSTIPVIKAMNKAVDYIKANPEDAARIARENMGLAPEAQVKVPDFRKYDQEDPQVIAGYMANLKSMSAILFEVPDLKDLYLRTSDVK